MILVISDRFRFFLLRSRLRRTFGFAFGRRGAWYWYHEELNMRLRQEITTRRTKSSPTAGNNKGASRLTTGKKLAYGEQNIRPLAELTPVYGGQ